MQREKLEHITMQTQPYPSKAYKKQKKLKKKEISSIGRASVLHAAG